MSLNSPSGPEAGEAPLLGAAFMATLSVLLLAGDWLGALGAVVAFTSAALVLHLFDPSRDAGGPASWNVLPSAGDDGGSFG